MLRLRKDQAEEVVVGVVDVAHSDSESSRFRILQPITCAHLCQGHRGRIILKCLRLTERFDVCQLLELFLDLKTLCGQNSQASCINCENRMHLYQSLPRDLLTRLTVVQRPAETSHLN